MLKNRLHRISIPIVFGLFAGYAFGAQAALKPRYAGFVMEENSSYVLFDKGATLRNHPASLTKIMTLYLLFEAIEVGRMKLTSKLKVSKHAASQPPSKIGVVAGTTITAEQAIKALVTKSANDVAVVIAENLAKTEQNFARLMTKRARVIGMNRTTFKNASGLHDDKQLSTARDMARLTKILRLRFRKYYHYFSTRSFTYRGRTFGNHNNLLGSYRGMDGVKTGYTRKSGYNLVSAVERNGVRLIGVVFGGSSAGARDQEMARMLNQAFKKIKTVPKSKLKAPQSFYRVGKPRLRFRGLPAPRQRPGKNRGNPTAAIEKPKARPAAIGGGGSDADWAVQIGAYTRYTSARRRVSEVTDSLGSGDSSVRSDIDKITTGGGTIFRARFVDLTEREAESLCEELKGKGIKCLILDPEKQDPL